MGRGEGGGCGAKRKGDIPGLQVEFGAYYYTRDGVHPAEVDDLVIYDVHHIERLVVCDRVHEDVAMDADGMLGIENRVLVLRSGAPC